MTSRLPYKWPFILSIVLHASIFVAGMVMADLLNESIMPADVIVTIASAVESNIDFILAC